MYPGNSEPITVCQEVYQIKQVLSKSVSTYHHLCHGRQVDQREKVVQKPLQHTFNYQYRTLAIKLLTLHHPFH